MKIFSYRQHQKLNSPNKKRYNLFFISFFKIIEIKRSEGRKCSEKRNQEKNIISIDINEICTHLSCGWDARCSLTLTYRGWISSMSIWSSVWTWRMRSNTQLWGRLLGSVIHNKAQIQELSNIAMD